MKNTKVLIGRSAADSRLMLCYATGGQKKACPYCHAKWREGER